MLAVGAGSAPAAADPGWFDGKSAEERQAIVDYLYQRTGHEPPHPGQAATMAAAIEGSVVQAGADDAPLAPGAGALELVVGTRVGLMTRLTTMVPTLWAAGGTFAAGYAIGWGARKLFATLTGPDDARHGRRAQLAVVLDHLAARRRRHLFRRQSAAVARRLPLRLKRQRRGDPLVRAAVQLQRLHAGRGRSHGVRRPLDGGVSRVGERRWAGDFPVFVDYPYLFDSDVRPAAPLRPTVSGDVIDRWEPFPPDPGATVVQDRLDALDDDGNDLLRDQIDTVLTPGSQPEEDPVRVGRLPRRRTERARHSSATRRRPIRARARRRRIPRAPDWDHDVDAFPGVLNPAARATQTVKLRWGDGTHGWGYRHVKFRHGWDAAARLRTELALADRSPTVEGLPTSFRYVASLPGGPRGCRQRVIVSYREDDKVPVGRHVITSFVDGDG